MNARPQAWLQQAKDDLGVARLTRDNSYYPQACYFASQAAEKALKGLILELGAEPPHTHVLGELLKLLGQLGCELEALEALPLRSLSRLSVTSHYPLEATPPAELFDRADADQAIGTAEAVLSLVEALDQPL